MYITIKNKEGKLKMKRLHSDKLGENLLHWNCII